MAMFCRHNRLTAKCPICRKELEAQLPKAAPKPRSRASTSSRSSTPRRSASTARPTGLVTRRLARAADDGYRNALVPGLRATADAERLAHALLAAAGRLTPPGPYEIVATEPDRDEALWVAFLLALVGPDAPERQAAIAEARPSWASGELPDLPEAQARTVMAYRQWAQRAGSQQAGFEGEPEWSPTRRYNRLFERLSLPGFGRAARVDLLTTLGAAGLYEIEADALRFGGEDDPTTLAAKRALVSGDRMLLERRARELAEACGVPLAALDRGLAEWGDPARDVPEAEVPQAMRRALRLP